MKRLFDIVLAILSIIIFAIPILIIYLSIRLSGGDEVIYRQERIGYHGKPFMLFKFRSMMTNAEMDGQPMLYTNDDPRLTRIGRFLRAHHLDEFPQLWNILRGEMSFVGPRPERKYYIDQIMQHTHDYMLIYQMRPGLTSEATLYNGYTDTMEKMLKRLDMDLRYLENRSLGLDMKIILSTVYGMLSGKKF